MLSQHDLGELFSHANGMVASRIMHDPISLVFVRCEIGVERRGSGPVHDVRIWGRIVANVRTHQTRGRLSASISRSTIIAPFTA